MARKRLSRFGPPPTFICENCQQVKPRRLCLSKGENNSGWAYKQRFCSKSCLMQHRGKQMALKRGERGSISEKGYRVTSNGKRKTYEYEHVQVMEQMLGRKLLPGETVHHKNGIRHDNTPTNLELWRHKHGKGGRVSDLVAWAHEIVNQYGEAPFTQEHIEQGRKDVQALFGC